MFVNCAAIGAWRGDGTCGATLLEAEDDLGGGIGGGALRPKKLDFFLGLGTLSKTEVTGSGSGGGMELRRKSASDSSSSSSGSSFSFCSSSSLKSIAYGSRTRRVFRLGIISPSSPKVFRLGGDVDAGLRDLELLIKGVCEAIDCNDGLVDNWLYRASGSEASIARPPTTLESWSESIVVRNGATVLGMRWSSAIFGPALTKSIRSVIESWLTTASRASNLFVGAEVLVRLDRIADIRGDEKLAPRELEDLRALGIEADTTREGVPSDLAGPVDRMKSAKSPMESLSGLASRACGALGRNRDPVFGATVLAVFADLPEEIDLVSAAGTGGLELKPGNLLSEEVRDREVTGLSSTFVAGEVFRALSGDCNVSLVFSSCKRCTHLDITHILRRECIL